METKRCTYCHKLQRVGNRVCSRCGRPFDRYSSRGGRSRSNSRSLFSLPAASPHRIGHYSGLHPEDQPYQSQMMIMPQRFIQEMQEKKALQEEPKHIVLPSVQNTPVGNRRRSISQAPIHRSLPTQRSRRRLASERTLRGNQQGTVGRDVERERGQISRPFVREVTSPGIHAREGDRKGRDGVNPSSALRHADAAEESTSRCVDEGLAPSRPLRSPVAQHASPLSSRLWGPALSLRYLMSQHSYRLFHPQFGGRWIDSINCYAPNPKA